jgi:hypothetical protein
MVIVFAPGNSKMDTPINRLEKPAYPRRDNGHAGVWEKESGARTNVL